MKDSLKQVGIYTITGSLCKAISFAALPFFVNYLSAGDIGILNIFSTCIVFLTPIISMGVLYTISIDYFKLGRKEYAEVLSTGLLIPAFLSLLMMPVLYFLHGPLNRAFSFQPAFFWLIPAALFVNFCFEAFIILVRNQNKVNLFAIVSFLKVVVEIGLSILFIVFLYKSWYSRALAFLFSGIVTMLLFFYHISKEKFLVAKLNVPVLKNELYFGLSGMVLQTAIFFINSSDKFFVMSFFGKEQAGYYSVASTFATIQYIICTSLLQYLQPVLFSAFAEGKKWTVVKGLFYKYFAAMLCTLAAVCIGTFIVYNYLLKPAYRPYLYYFYILGASAFMWTIANIFLQYIVFNKNKKVLVQLSLICIAAAVFINYVSAKYAGINWLAMGQVATGIIVIAVMLFYNQRLKFFA